MSGKLTQQSTRPLLSGHSIPILGLGTWRSQPGEVCAAVKAALENNYRHFDCAWTYENEAEVGEGLRLGMDQCGVRRDELFITSKLWCNQLKYDAAIHCAKDSISKLGCQYLDLLLIHWPVAFQYFPCNKFAENADKSDRYFDDSVDVFSETWSAMEALVDQGLVRSIGVSNFSIAQIEHLLTKCRIRPACNQIETHPYLNQRKQLEYLTSKGMVLTAYSGFGNLARNDEEKAQTPLNDPLIAELAAQHGRSPAQIILRWHLQRGHVVIPKSSSPTRIAENATLFDFELTVDEMARIEELGAKKIRFINPTFLPKMEKFFDQHSDE